MSNSDRSHAVPTAPDESRDGDNNDGRNTAAEGPRDVALIGGVTPEGDVQVLRQREDRVELGLLRPLREGIPITGELVRLIPRKEFPLLCDVKTEMRVPVPSAAAFPPSSDVKATALAGPSRAAETRKGPAQVATDEYRKNWDVIWSGSKRGTGGGLAN